MTRLRCMVFSGFWDTWTIGAAINEMKVTTLNALLVPNFQSLRVSESLRR
jgi:hypothetical protein